MGDSSPSKPTHFATGSAVFGSPRNPGEPATDFRFAGVSGLAVDADQNVYIVEARFTLHICKVDAITGLVRRISVNI